MHVHMYNFARALDGFVGTINCTCPDRSNLKPDCSSADVKCYRLVQVLTQIWTYSYRYIDISYIDIYYNKCVTRAVRAGVHARARARGARPAPVPYMYTAAAARAGQHHTTHIVCIRTVHMCASCTMLIMDPRGRRGRRSSACHGTPCRSESCLRQAYRTPCRSRSRAQLGRRRSPVASRRPYKNGTW